MHEFVELECANFASCADRRRQTERGCRFFVVSIAQGPAKSLTFWRFMRLLRSRCPRFLREPRIPRLVTLGGAETMFDLDVSKLLIVGVVALIVVGPKDLPRILRIVGQGVGKMRRVRNEVRGQFTELMKEADLEGTKRELDALERSSHIDIAVNPKTAMRGELPVAADSQAAAGPAEETYTSAAMRDYLSAAPDGLAAAEVSQAIESAAKRDADDEGGESCLEKPDEVRGTRADGEAAALSLAPKALRRADRW
jgi:sec-independent protein translocase protein TatB